MRFKMNQNTILIIVFLLVITLPALYMFVTPIQRVSLVENRPLAQIPQINIRSGNLSGLGTDIESFLNDHFGFRESLIQLNSWFHYFVMDTSVNDGVILGEDDWLFFEDTYAGVSIQDVLRGVAPDLSTDTLEFVRLTLEARRDELARYGIDYYWVVTPEKQTIYPEYLPNSHEPSADNTWFDQIFAYLDEHSDITYIDLRPAMQAAAQANPDIYYYYTLDTHWTSEGAWIGYEATMDRLNRDYPGLQNVEWNQFHTFSTKPRNDLVDMLGLQNWLSSSLPDRRYAKNRCAVSLKTEELDQRWRFEHAINDNEFGLQYNHCPTAPNPQSILMFHDSFGASLQPFFAESFEFSAFIWSRYDSHLMQTIEEDFHPDIVIDQWIARYLIEVIMSQQGA